MEGWTRGNGGETLLKRSLSSWDREGEEGGGIAQNQQRLGERFSLRYREYERAHMLSPAHAVSKDNGARKTKKESEVRQFLTSTCAEMRNIAVHERNYVTRKRKGGEEGGAGGKSEGAGRT